MTPHLTAQERPEERARAIYDAIGEDDFDRLTHGDTKLETVLKGVLVRIWGVGYEEGVRRGAELLAQAVAAKANR